MIRKGRQQQSCAVDPGATRDRGVPPGGSCHYFVTFTPQQVGSFSTTSISLIEGTNASIAMRGTGVAASKIYLPVVTR